jgi:integrase
MTERTRYAGVYRRGKRFTAVASVRGRKTWKTFDTAGEARSWKATYEAQRPSGAERPGSDPTVAEVVGAWTTAHERDWKPLTKAGRESLYRIHIGPALGERRVSELLSEREHLRALYRAVSPAQARNIHGALRGAFRWAISEEIIERDPTDLVKPPAYRRPEARYLDLEDVRRLRELVTGHALEGAVILGLAGLRAAEATYVHWGDLADNVLHVRGSSWNGKTKTGRTRSLTLPTGEVSALRAFKAREAERLLAVGIRIDERTTILTDGLGDPMGSKYLGAIFAAFARSNGLNCTYHSLRHTSASLMLASGTDVRTVAGRLGHASATTTLATYSHLIGQADRDAAERLEALLSRTPG